MKHVLYNDDCFQFRVIPNCLLCGIAIFFFHRVKRKQSTLNVSRERCGEKKCIN